MTLLGKEPPTQNYDKWLKGWQVHKKIKNNPYKNSKHEKNKNKIIKLERKNISQWIQNCYFFLWLGEIGGNVILSGNLSILSFLTGW